MYCTGALVVYYLFLVGAAEQCIAPLIKVEVVIFLVAVAL